MRADCPSAGFIPSGLAAEAIFMPKAGTFYSSLSQLCACPGRQGQGSSPWLPAGDGQRPAHGCCKQWEREHLAVAEQLLFARIMVTQ